MTHSRGNAAPTIAVIFFDFSGVLAEEGFIEGLRAIGRAHGGTPCARPRA
jgi:putative hydrolase of the HAD superfamily